MSTPELFTADDWVVSVTLERDGVAADVSAATSIDAAITDTNDANASIIVPQVSASAVEAGADWANGVVVLVFPAASTGITHYGAAYVEVQVTNGGRKQTWPRVKVQVRKGTIA